MLTSIRCDAFVDDLRQIDIKPGLNTILGSSEGSNAIGKSTFLWIIDYIFGGQQYNKLMPGIQQHTGSQVIYFTFRFGEENRYFYRNTEDPEKIYSCDAEGHMIEGMTLKEYNSFLRESYLIDQIGVTFPGIVNHFFRIYGGKNTNEQKPMIGRGDSEKKAVDFLLQLFGYGMLLSQIDRMEDELNVKLYDVIYKKSIQRSEYEEKIETNNHAIVEMENRLKQLMSQTDDLDISSLGLDTRMIEVVSKLQIELRQITAQYESLRSQLEAVKMNMAETMTEQRSEFTALKTFFPAINIKAFEDIESFHTKLRIILRDEMQDEIDRLQPMVDFYNNEINRLKGKIRASGITRSISERIMSQCVSAKQTIEALRAENDRLEHERDLQIERNERINRLRVLADEHKNAIKEAERRMNECLDMLNSDVTNEKEKAPELSITDQEVFFGREDNTSEGTAFKNMVIYDLCLARLCSVPVIIHDSNILKRIDDAYLEGILRHYQQCGSQVFIAFDKAETMKEETRKILEETQLFKLYDGHELFGKSWSKLSAQAANEQLPIQEGEEDGGDQ